MTAAMTEDEAEDAARDSARRIIEVVSTFAPWVRLRLAMALTDEPSATLSGIGDALLGENPVSRMATVGSSLTCSSETLRTSRPHLGTPSPGRPSANRSRTRLRPGTPLILVYEHAATMQRGRGRWEVEARQRRGAEDAEVVPLAPVPAPRMATRLCRRCQMPATSSRHWLCDDCRVQKVTRTARGARLRQQAKTAARGYAGKHAALRKRWTRESPPGEWPAAGADF